MAGALQLGRGRKGRTEGHGQGCVHGGRGKSPQRRGLGPSFLFPAPLIPMPELQLPPHWCDDLIC